MLGFKGNELMSRSGLCGWDEAVSTLGHGNLWLISVFAPSPNLDEVTVRCCFGPNSNKMRFTQKSHQALHNSFYKPK